jgi:hypothetical protein
MKRQILLKLNNQFNKLFKRTRNKDFFQKLEKNLIIKISTDSNMVSNGFEKYDKPKYYLKIIDINNFGLMVKYYLAQKDIEEELEAGTYLKTIFLNKNYINTQFENGFFRLISQNDINIKLS